MTTWQFRAAALMMALVPGVHTQPRELHFDRNLLSFPQPATCSINPPPRIIPLTPTPTMDTSSPTGAPSYAPTESPTMGPTDSPTQGPTYAPTDSPTMGPTMAPTIGETSAPTVPGCPYYSLDFSEYNKGDWITTQYRLSHSVIINVEKRAGCNKYSSLPGSTDSNGLMAARIFDTAHPGPCYRVNNRDQGCDPDLGSPHPGCQAEGFPGAGPNGDLYPGHGDGGDPAKQPNRNYWNCQPQGNVLIVDEGWDTPDDSGCGGVIQFSFTQPADISVLGLLDIDDDKPVRVTIEDTDGVEHERLSPTNVGDNAIYEMVIDVENAVTLRVYYTSSGSVSYINYNLCPDPRRFEQPDYTSENTCETALVYCEPAYRREWCGQNTPAGLPNRWGWSNMVNTAQSCYIGAGMDNCDTNVGSVAGKVDIDYLANKFNVTIANGWTLLEANFISGPEVDKQVTSAWNTYPLNYNGYSDGGMGPGLHQFEYTDGIDINDFMVGHMVVCADGVDPAAGIMDGQATLDPPSTSDFMIIRDFEDIDQAKEWSNWRWSGRDSTSSSTWPVKNPQDLTRTTNYLGFFGRQHSGNWANRKAAQKMSTTFEFPNNAVPAAVKFQFDVITFDEWEYSDKVYVTIKDKKFHLGQYDQDSSAARVINKQYGCNSNNAWCDIEGWKPNGEDRAKKALVSVDHTCGLGNIGIRSRKDGVHRFEIILPPYYYPAGDLFVEFDFQMSSNVKNEGGAIDNIHIYSLDSMPSCP